MNTSDAPLVSVIMPVYNGEQYLAQAIESILSQSYSHLELLILDNGSTDNTSHILSDFARRDERIRLFSEPLPLGYGGEVASNVAARQAKGVFIAKLDADDVAKPERLAKQVAFLLENPDVFLVGSHLELIDSNGHATGERLYPSTHEAIYHEFYLRFPIANPSIMYRNLLEADLYQIRFSHFNDYYSLFLLIKAGMKVHNLPECLTAYRIHTMNTVFTNLRDKWQSNLAIKRCFVEEFGYIAPIAHQLKIKLITVVINHFPEHFLTAIMNRGRRLINA